MQVGAIRQHLADIYEREQNWRQAAEVLVGIPLETGQKQYTVAYKLETYLKIARLYLEDEDPAQGTRNNKLNGGLFTIRRFLIRSRVGAKLL